MKLVTGLKKINLIILAMIDNIKQRLRIEKSST